MDLFFLQVQLVAALLQESFRLPSSRQAVGFALEAAIFSGSLPLKQF